VIIRLLFVNLVIKESYAQIFNLGITEIKNNTLNLKQDGGIFWQLVKSSMSS
jgi:hypothetical protein